MKKPVAALRAANLNLVPILQALLREQSVTRAAAVLALSPSATSCALANLRDLFGDPLLVRVGREMRRTPRAEQLLERLDGACLALENLLYEAAFDPAAMRRNFVIAAPDYLDLLLGPGLVHQLRRHAPGVRIRFVGIPDDLERQLAWGEIDIALGDLKHLRWRGLSTMPGFADRLVGLVDAAHPLPDVVTPDAIARYPVALWNPGRALRARSSRAGPSTPFGLSPVVAVQSQTALIMLAPGSDLVCVAPQALARHMGKRLQVRMFEMPGEPVRFETGLLWSAVRDDDPAHQWLRALLAAAMRDVHDA